MKRIVLEMKMTDDPYAEGAIVDCLNDALYNLSELGYIEDSNDEGWEYTFE